ncbi:MAG: hypothetical protein ACYCXA_08710 [Actinomycetes bacterium]
MFGPEPWSELAGRPWSYWDLWFVAVAVAVSDYGGSLDELEAHLANELRSHVGRQGAESKLSHLADLRFRLEEAGLTPADLATPVVLVDKRVLARARKKVSDGWVEGRAMAPAMIETPRVRLVRRARYGRWSAFPVDPGRYYKSFRRHVEVKDHISKYKSFAAVDRVEDRLRSLDQPPLTAAQRLALYRAFHTAGLELADRTDDSHGNVGQLRRDAWHTYLGLDWQGTGLRAEDYWADVCDLVVFEDYALDYQEEALPWRRVPAGHAELIEGFLLSLASECRSHYLDYQAEEALQQLAWLAVGGRRFSRYVDAAARLGSDHWMPIEAMAESALRSGHRELAVEVFRAADRPGHHQEHLRQRCLVLTGVDIDDEEHDPRPKLRAVPNDGGR